MNSVRFGAVRLIDNDDYYPRFHLTDEDVDKFKALKSKHDNISIYANPDNTYENAGDAFAYYPKWKGYASQAATQDDYPLIQELLNRATGLSASLKKRLLEALEVQMKRNAAFDEN